MSDDNPLPWWLSKFAKDIKNNIQDSEEKYCQNGQSITFVTDDKHKDICQVCTAYTIYLQAKCLGKLDD